MSGTTGSQPSLETERLQLRPFTLADAPEVRRLAGAREIAEMTAVIPHPYEEGMAEDWISGHAAGFEAGTEAVFAVVVREAATLCGAVRLRVVARNRHAELGYWIGVPYWGLGYASEAARAAVAYGFEQLGLHRVYASCFARNAASARVLEKIGMQHEGCLREHLLKWDRFEDIVKYGVLAREWPGRAGGEG